MDGIIAIGAAKSYTDKTIDERMTTGTVPKGGWNAETNVPTLSDATGQNGWYYDVTNPGTFNGVHYVIGDKIKHNGTNWYRIPTGIESNGPIPVKYIKNTDQHLPNCRESGSALIIGDYVLIDTSSPLDFVIDGIEVTSYADIIEYIGNGNWQKKIVGSAKTNEVTVNNLIEESIPGNLNYQDQINAYVKQALLDRIEKSSIITSFSDLQPGDTSSIPNANSVKVLTMGKVDKTTTIAGLTLEENIAANALVNAIKEVARIVKNVTFDCDDNTLRGIIVSCFKSGEVLSSITNITTEEYKLATAKAIIDYVTSRVQGAIILKGKKATLAEIEAITGASVNDEWFCEANAHFYIYTDSGTWMDSGGGVDLSNCIMKSDIVNNCTTNDAQKALSAAQGKMLKDLVDTKQDIIDITNKGSELTTLNSSLNLVFNNSKLNFFLGMTIMNIDAAPTTPITNKQSARREILRLPVPPTSYAYPGQTRIEITHPSGYYTCEENRHEFYDTDGSNYVKPDIADGVTFRFITAVKVENAYDQNGNEILIAQQLSNPSGAKIVNADGSPKITMNTVEIIEGGTENPKVYTLKIQPGQGYHYVGTYYDSQGNPTTGDFYELVEVPIVFNKTYMYQCYLMNKMLSVVGKNFLVDSQGRLCTVEIVEDEYSKLLQASEAGALFSYYSGFDGDITITPITNANTLDQITVSIEPHEIEVEDPETHEITTEIDYYSVFTNGTNTYSDINIQKAY